jgi:hypothetical protein
LNVYLSYILQYNKNVFIALIGQKFAYID